MGRDFSAERCPPILASLRPSHVSSFDPSERLADQMSATSSPEDPIPPRSPPPISSRWSRLSQDACHQGRGRPRPLRRKCRAASGLHRKGRPTRTACLSSRRSLDVISRSRRPHAKRAVMIDFRNREPMLSASRLSAASRPTNPHAAAGFCPVRIRDGSRDLAGCDM